MTIHSICFLLKFLINQSGYIENGCGVDSHWEFSIGHIEKINKENLSLV